ncbi:MAG: AIM24 family protein [Cyanobacteriota bacterium]
MVSFEIVEKEFLKMVKINLSNETVRTEAGAMYYYHGNIQMDAQMQKAGGLLKSFVSGEKLVRPTYAGTGVLYLEPSYGEFTILEVSGNEWILDQGAFYASEMSVNVDAFRNKAISGMVSGEGMWQTKVSGSGKVVITSQGPLETIELNNSKLVVDGKFAVARTGNLEFKVEKATKGLFGSMISGEGLVNTYSGTGKVLVAPVPHQYAALMSKLDRLAYMYSSSST